MAIYRARLPNCGRISGRNVLKIVVEAKVRMDAVQRDALLAGARRWIDGALAEPGCQGYAWTADPFEADLVHIFEEWESEVGLAAHLVGPQYLGMLKHVSEFGITDAVSRKFAVANEGPVYNAAGVATADFD